MTPKTEETAREKARQRAWEIVQRDFRQPMEPEGYMRATAGLISGLEEAVVAEFEAYESALRERDEKVTDLRAKLTEAEKLVKAVEDSSEWDDGVFYFNGKYSPEIELAINAFKASR